MATRMLQRRGSSAEWATVNPVLGDGEIGIEKDTGIIKIGDGVKTWQELDPAFEDPAVKRVFGRVGDVTATSADLTDATSIGRAVISSETQAEARSAIGAGTGNGNGNVVGTGVLNIVSLSKAAYDAIATKDPNTLYVIPVN